MPPSIEGGFLKCCAVEDSEGSLGSMRKHSMTDQTCATETNVTAMHLPTRIYMISCSKIKITFPILPWNILPWYLHGLCLYILQFFTQTTLPVRPPPVSQSKIPAPFPFKNISYPVPALFSPQHLPPCNILIYFVGLSPPLECKFHEGIWSLLYPQKLGQ